MSGSLCTPFSERRETLQFHLREENSDEPGGNDGNAYPKEQKDDQRVLDPELDLIAQSSGFVLVNNLTDRRKTLFDIDVDIDIVSTYSFLAFETNQTNMETYC